MLLPCSGEPLAARAGPQPEREPGAPVAARATFAYSPLRSAPGLSFFLGNPAASGSAGPLRHIPVRLSSRRHGPELPEPFNQNTRSAVSRKASSTPPACRLRSLRSYNMTFESLGLAPAL